MQRSKMPRDPNQRAKAVVDLATGQRSSEPVREYRDYCTKIHHELTDLAWLYHMNHGIFMTPGVEEEWTLSIAHSDEDLERYLGAFEAFANDVTGAPATNPSYS